LFNNLLKADAEVRSGKWLREENRGIELDGKTIGLIGYGNTGKAFARKLRGFEVNVICHDIKPGVGDQNARQVDLEELQRTADVLSLHIPQTPLTLGMVNKEFIEAFEKPFWLLNTARGTCVVTSDLVNALKTREILGAGLDVLEYEKSSFENLFKSDDVDSVLPDAFKYLIKSKNVILSPHVAGWTVESHIKLAQTIVDKVKSEFF
jgi:D-3-phosphoglycerate dehydrogenase